MKITTPDGRVRIQTEDADVSILMEEGETAQQTLLRSARLLYASAEYNIQRAQFRELAAASLGPPLEIELLGNCVMVGERGLYRSISAEEGETPAAALRRVAKQEREQAASATEEHLEAAAVFEQAALQLEKK
jgi:hypothetical protein